MCTIAICRIFSWNDLQELWKILLAYMADPSIDLGEKLIRGDFRVEKPTRAESSLPHHKNSTISILSKKLIIFPTKPLYIESDEHSDFFFEVITPFPPGLCEGPESGMGDGDGEISVAVSENLGDV
jgi:hypothetical protein